MTWRSFADPAKSRGSSLRSSARRLRLVELGEACIQLGPQLPITQFTDLPAMTIAVGERERAANLRKVTHGVAVLRSGASGRQRSGV